MSKADRIKVLSNEYKLTEANALLENIANTPNKIEVADFNKFLPIFYKYERDELTDAERDRIRDLSSEYFQLIDPYKATNIVDVNGEVLAVLPAAFVKFNAIDTDKANMVDKNRTINEANTLDVYKREAFNEMVQGLTESQLNNEHLKEIIDARAEFIKLAKAIKEEIPPEQVNFDNNAVQDDSLFEEYEDDF